MKIVWVFICFIHFTKNIKIVFKLNVIKLSTKYSNDVSLNYYNNNNNYYYY